MIRIVFFFIISLFLACSSKVLNHRDADSIMVNQDYEERIKIKELPPQPAASGTFVLYPSPAGDFPKVPEAVPVTDKKIRGKKKAMDASGPPSNSDPNHAAVPQREPPIEDAEGFVGRRPIVDPFRVGERVTLEVSYFGVSAGDMILEVLPFSEVNGRKSYHLVARAKSTSVFAMFYAVDDMAETFVDYETLVPYNYSLHVKESKQLREVRSIFDWQKNHAYTWDKKITQDSGVEEKKEDWEILPYSQNVFSGPFYMRTYKMQPGKNLAFRVAHEKKNYTITAEVLRREKLSTPIGDLNTIVIRPKIEISGVFQPVGEILFWMTDDDRKFIVRIESKIKIGKIVAMVKSIDRAGP